MPNTRSPVLTAEDIEFYKSRINPETGKKYTQNDIAKLFKVSRQYVSEVKNKNPHHSRTPREMAIRDWYPWKTGEKFRTAPANRRMRDHAEYMATGGKGMTQEKLDRLRWLYDHLISEDLVVEFDPNIPPSDEGSFAFGSNQAGGFAFRKRQESDGDLIIRVNEHTALTEESRRIWKLPPRLPKA